MWPSKPEVLRQYDRYHCNFDGKPGVFDHAQKEETDLGRLRRRPTTGNCNGRFARQSCNFSQSVVVAIIWLIFCLARRHRKSQIWRWNLDAICQSSKDVITSGFWGQIDISGCRSLLYLLANIILHLYMVLYPIFIVEILTAPFMA